MNCRKELCKFPVIKHNSWIVALLVLTCFCYQSVCGQAGPGAADYKKGLEFQKKKMWKEAIDAFKEAINKESNNYKYFFAMAYCQTNIKPPQYDEAIKSYTEALKVNSGFTNAYVYIAQVYAKKNDYPKAVENFGIAFEKETDQSKKILYKIQTIKLLTKIDKKDEAVKEIQELKKLAPNDLRVLSMEGEVYGNSGKWEEALQAHRAAVAKAKEIKLQPQEIAKYQYGEGLACCKLNKTDDYKNILGQLKTSNPTQAKKLERACKGDTRHLTLAIAYFQVGEYTEAEKYVKIAIDKKDNLAAAYKVYGMINAKQGKFQQAITQYSQAAENEPDAAKRDKLYNLLMNLQFQNNMYSEALQNAQKILEKTPNNNKVLYLKAQAEYNLQKYSEAITSLEKSIQLQSGSQPPMLAKYNFLLGLASKKGGQKDKAKAAFEKSKYKPFKSAAEEEIKMISAN